MFQVLFDVHEVRTLTDERIARARALIRTHHETKLASRRAIEESRALMHAIRREELKREARAAGGDIEPFSRASPEGFPATLRRPFRQEGISQPSSFADLLHGKDFQPAAGLLAECKRLLGALIDSQTPTASLYDTAGHITEYYWTKLDKAQQTRLRQWLGSAREAGRRITALQSVEASVRRSEIARGALAGARRNGLTPSKLQVGSASGPRPPIGHSTRP